MIFNFLRNFLVVFIFSFLVVDSQFSFPTTELQALQSIYDSTNGPDWYWGSFLQIGARWNFTAADPNPCASSSPWQGVNCSSSCDPAPCNVVGLSLAKFGLVGSLPEELGNLTRLEILDLNDNLLTGLLPPSFYTMTSLLTVNLSYNLLEGPFSHSFSGLQSLRSLNLSYNSFKTILPVTLGLLTTNLTYLDLSYSHFHGHLPSEWNQLFVSSALQELDLSNNYINGSLAASLFSTADLLSPVSPSPSSLIRLNIGNNQLEDCPPSVFFTSLQDSLQYLIMDYNHFYCALPQEFYTMHELKLFNVAGNLINSTLSSSIQFLQNLEHINLHINFFHGTLPPEIGSLTHLQVLDLSGNRFEASLPKELGLLKANLSHIDITSNNFNGSLPSTLNNLIALQYLAAKITLVR